jgi:hypothetical protein
VKKKGGIIVPRVSKTATAQKNSYIVNGVSISPAVPTAGKKVKVMYDGLLAKSGAAHVYARVGFGNKWDNLYDFQMDRTEMGFETTIPVLKSDSMNLCFKDCANNWDNNSGANYTFMIVQ